MFNQSYVGNRYHYEQAFSKKKPGSDAGSFLTYSKN